MASRQDALAALVAAPPQEQTRYPANSRYFGLPARVRRLPDGREATWLVPRVLPDPAQMTDLAVHTVAPLDRTDLLAARYFGDPLVSWRIADANGRGLPEELTRNPGTRLRIAVPDGMG